MKQHKAIIKEKVITSNKMNRSQPLTCQIKWRSEFHKTGILKLVIALYGKVKSTNPIGTDELREHYLNVCNNIFVHLLVIEISIPESTPLNNAVSQSCCWSYVPIFSKVIEGLNTFNAQEQSKRLIQIGTQK